MPLVQTENYRKQDVRLSEIANALAHPARIAILRTLASTQGCVCGDLVDGLPLAQATVSQHLKKLQSAGLISCKYVGPSSCYEISANAHDALSAVAQELTQILTSDRHKQGCCQ